MRIQLQLRLTTDDGDVISDTEVIRLNKGEDRLEMLGLSLDEAKALPRRVQEQLVTAPKQRPTWPATGCALSAVAACKAKVRGGSSSDRLRQGAAFEAALLPLRVRPFSDPDVQAVDRAPD
jgi:hypothetical protein